MNSTLGERLERVRELLTTVRHVAIATVNDDGSPHNSPVFAAVDDQLRVYWASRTDPQHSRNIARTGQAFIVLFDSIGEGGGLYLKSRVRALEPNEVSEGLITFNATRKRCEKAEVSAEMLNSTSQRLYCAEPEQMWVNLAERDESGCVVRDYRYEISPADLTA
jgi:hypothetical protein